MSGQGFSVILVHSVSWAIRIERILARGQVASRLLPVPRHLSSDCGVCVRVGRTDLPRALALLQEEGADFDCVHGL